MVVIDDKIYNNSNYNEFNQHIQNRYTDLYSQDDTLDNKSLNISINDDNWNKDKNAIDQLNQNIKNRKHSYNTYKQSLDNEKKLYNKERHKTLLLSIANIIALGGCIYVWTSISLQQA